MAVTMGKRESLEGSLEGWTIDDLKALKQDRLMELFLTLLPPTMEEMEGEWRGYLLDTGRFWLIKRPVAHFALNSSLNQGRWLGKGFSMTSDSKGHGYNSYERFGKTRHVYPMRTRMAKSVFDGRDDFELDYTAYHSGAGFVNMIDEVRKVNDELYLGIGLWGYFRRQRRIPFFFALSGPRGPYTGIDRHHRERQRRFTR
jgi:hypothetical protein